MPRPFLSFHHTPRFTLPLVSALLVPAFSLSAQTAISPEEGESVVIEDAESPPVHGENGIGNVAVTVTENGSIENADTPAILGDGENWSLENSGHLHRQGDAGATVQLAEGSFTNEEDGTILWESDGDLTVSADGENLRFSSVFLESWTGDSANFGEIRASGLHDLVIEGSQTSVHLTGVHLGAREKEEEDNPLAFTNVGTVSAEWSGAISLSGDENDLRVTGVHLEELEWLDNDGIIEAVFDGNIDELAAGNSLEVTGVRTDGDADIYNYADGVIRAEIDATGTVADGATVAATGIRSEGKLDLVNNGQIEAIVADGLSSAEATGIIARDGATITNNSTGEILAQHAGSGTATGISVVLAEETPPEPDENGNGDNGDDEDENGEEEPPAPRRSTITNHGTISARAGEDGDATAISSDGRLTVSNSGTIEAGGIILSDEDADEIETADVASATGIHVQNGDGDITNSGTISAEGGFAVILEEGGILRNRGEIIGDIFLGADADATLSLSTDATIEGEVDGGGGTNTLELGGGSPFGWSHGEYDGSFENFSKLDVAGNNTIWTLTGDQEYADGTAITGGALLTSDQLISDISIGDNGTFISSGSVIGNIVTSGGILAGTLDEDDFFVAPEGGAVLHIDGDIAFEDGSYLQVIAGETSLDVTGNVVIGSQDPENGDGETPVLILVDAEWDQDYTILSASGIDGEFDGGYGFILLDIDYENPADVTARLGVNREAIGEAGETSNERSIARVLSDLQPVAGSELETAFHEFAEVGNAGNFGAIASTMNGEILASGVAAHSSFNRTVRQTIINTIQHRPNRYDNRFAAYPGAPVEEMFQPEAHLWSRVLGIWGDLDRPGDNGDVDYELHGIIAGYDTVRTEDARVGIAVIFGDTSVEQDADEIDGNVYQVIGYATKHGGGFLYDATLGYGYHDMESERRVLPSNTKTSASYDAHEFFGSAQVTMLLQEEGVSILPLAGLDFSHFRQDGFRESGAWGLSGDSVDFTSLQAFVGVRILGEHLTAGGGTVVPEIRFRYSHELLDRDAKISSRFVNDTNGGKFSTTGAERDAGEFEMGVGVMVQPGSWERVSIFADYDFSLQRQHALSAGFSYAF